MTLPDLLTLDEACAHVRLSPWALRRAIARGELRAYKPAGRIRISPDALAAWLESTAPPAAPAPVGRALAPSEAVPDPTPALVSGLAA